MPCKVVGHGSNSTEPGKFAKNVAARRNECCSGLLFPPELFIVAAVLRGAKKIFLGKSALHFRTDSSNNPSSAVRFCDGDSSGWRRLHASDAAGQAHASDGKLRANPAQMLVSKAGIKENSAAGVSRIGRVPRVPNLKNAFPQAIRKKGCKKNLEKNFDGI